MTKINAGRIKSSNFTDISCHHGVGVYSSYLINFNADNCKFSNLKGIKIGSDSTEGSVNTKLYNYIIFSLNFFS